MKKIYFLALLCLPFALKAQQGVVFKIKYQPDRNYTMNVSMGMKMTANVTGDSAVINKLKSSGITSPVNVDFELGMGGTMKSGHAGADNSFPLVMDYKINNLTVSANGNQAPIPPSVSEKDIRMVAHVSHDGVIMIDSANGKRTDDTTREKMKQMMGLFQKQIQFPDKPMKPGDSFTQSSPMTIPLGTKVGGDIKINYSVTYKLNNIADGKAYFDILPTFSMDFSIQNKVSVNMSGTGTGKMVYSIKDNYPLSNQGTFNMKLKVNAGKVNVDGDAVITANSTSTIN
jgi:hypothetical protein